MRTAATWLVCAAMAAGGTFPAVADWHYKPYEYEAWMLQGMRVENSRGILHYGYPGPHLTLAAEPEAFYAEGMSTDTRPCAARRACRRIASCAPNG